MRRSVQWSLLTRSTGLLERNCASASESGSGFSRSRFLYYSLSRECIETGSDNTVPLADKSREPTWQLEIFIPILALEQQRIVGILDEAFDGIATAKANAEKNLRTPALCSKVICNPSSPNAANEWIARSTLAKFAQSASQSLTFILRRRRCDCNLIHVGWRVTFEIENTATYVDRKTSRRARAISILRRVYLLMARSTASLYGKIRPLLVKLAGLTSRLCSADMYPLAPNRRML